MTPTAKKFARLVTGSWLDEIKSLPKYQIQAIARAAKVSSEVQRFKLGIISKKELQVRLKEILH